jgi:hypothetical protein
MQVMLLLPEQQVGLFVAFNCYGVGAAEMRPTLGERFVDFYFPLSLEPEVGGPLSRLVAPSSGTAPQPSDTDMQGAAQSGEEEDEGSPRPEDIDASGYGRVQATATGGDELAQKGVPEDAREEVGASRRGQGLRVGRAGKVDITAQFGAQAQAARKQKEAALEAKRDQVAAEANGRRTNAGKEARNVQNWMDNHFEDYTEALKAGDDGAVRPRREV